jgi:hypothetical protein
MHSATSISVREPRFALPRRAYHLARRFDCRLSLAETPARGDRSRRASVAGFSPARRRSHQPTPRQSARLGRSPRPPAVADQPARLRRAKSSTRSAALATLSAGLVIRVAISRARARRGRRCSRTHRHLPRRTLPPYRRAPRQTQGPGRGCPLDPGHYLALARRSSSPLPRPRIRLPHAPTERKLRNHIAQLTAMGYRVTLEPLA